MMPRIVGAVAALVVAPALAQAQVASCAGAGMAGAAYLACSHTEPGAPSQLCTYHWTLQTESGLRTFQGSFDLLPGQTNRVVFQTGGVGAQIGRSVTQCQDALWDRPEPRRP